MIHFSDNGNFEVGHSDCYYGRFLDVRFEFFLNHKFCFGLGKSTHFEGTQYGKIYMTCVVNQILLEGSL